MEYKSTLNLPKTDFPMKADLPNREPLILKKWQEIDLYGKLRKRYKGKAKYVLHDGPPYANGSIHMGHALNKLLKDIVVRYKTMRGRDSPYVPGWDCHGLPVEHQLFKELKMTKYDIGQVEFRRKAYDYAMKYVRIQAEEFKRLGILGDWERSYQTLSKDYEAEIVRSFARLVEKGYVYKSLKPVNWCASCETALAEAEVEYEDKVSPSIYVKFSLANKEDLKIFFTHECGAKRSLPGGDERVRSEAEPPRRGRTSAEQSGASPKGTTHDEISFLIWTTTPWTLVANVAIAVHPEHDYVLAEVQKSEVRSQKSESERYILAKELVHATMDKAGIKEFKILKTFKGRELEGLEARHPFIDRKSKVVLAEYVSMENGSGCVHTAPGHGQEDYITGKKYNLPTIMPVDPKGKFDKTSGEFSGMGVYKANKAIVEKLKLSENLVHYEEVTHSYPHCWRCKKPIIFRATEQYFLNIDNKNLRREMLGAISSKIKWIPAAGEARISAMVRTRPDWCLSRQRYWGVPIIAFYCKGCKVVLLDAKVIDHVAALFEKEGADAWFLRKEEGLLPEGTKCPECGGTNFTKETDILDVWFDSGVSHQAVLKKNKELGYPCELYLEGSDQHRGWFQSALITAMAIDGIAPYRNVLTHGFVVDGEGKKMSKSLGNVITPQEVMRKYGADILRLWVASSDYSEDIRMSDEIVTRLADAYRKIRNTYKYLLSNLYDYDPSAGAVRHEKMLEIDRWILSRLSQVIKDAEAYYEAFEFHKVYRDVYNFCVYEISSVYLDILKDRMYTFKSDSIERKSGQTAMFELLSALVKIMAPLLAITADEAWGYLKSGNKSESVHLEPWPEDNYRKWRDGRLDEKWARLITIRETVLKRLEEKRQSGEIGSSLEAKVVLGANDEAVLKLLNDNKNELRYLFIVSQVEVIAGEAAQAQEAGGVSVEVEKAAGSKCQRCWNYSELVGKDKLHPTLCERCVSSLRGR